MQERSERNGTDNENHHFIARDICDGNKVQKSTIEAVANDTLRTFSDSKI